MRIIHIIGFAFFVATLSVPAAGATDSLKTAYKDYGELLSGAVSDTGMFTVHRVGTDFYFEIPPRLMERDILIVNKISSVPQKLNEASVNRGMSYAEMLVRFNLDTLRRMVWVTEVEPHVSSPADHAITRSVRDNHRHAIIEYFPIEAFAADGAPVIKINKVFDGSERSLNNVFYSIGIAESPRRELSMIESVRSFPTNVVVKSVMSARVSGGLADANLTVDVTSNIVLLPREHMVARFGDDRIGYFTVPHIHFNDTQQKVEVRELITRWRLAPRPEDVERYLRGELVEPERQIVLHIDPATPPVWIPYIIKGVEDWQGAFEQAGFRNAIVARQVDPLTDEEFDIDDIRYSVIVYAASQRANAMGPSVVDPRSGEIIEANIMLWHNVLSLLHTWLRVQTGAVDPAARGNVLPTELIGDALRFVVSHEMGHSLGLKHNFGASYAIPVDSLRSKTFTDLHGTSVSIMDYVRFNYVAQPGDGVTQLSPLIGIYDLFAVDWGYRWSGAGDPRNELATLDATLRRREDDPVYRYGPQTADAIDPRNQSEDLGDDAVEASRLGIANLKRMMPHIVEWTYEEGQMRFEAGRFLNSIVSQWRQYLDHVLTNIGGVYVNDVVYGREMDRFVPVPAGIQRRSLRFLIDEALTVPAWLFDPEIWAQTFYVRESPVGLKEYPPLMVMRDMINTTLYSLVADDRLHRMFEAEAQLGRGGVLTVEEMLGTLTGHIFGGRDMRELSIRRRVEQKSYVDALIAASAVTLRPPSSGSATSFDCRWTERRPATITSEQMERMVEEAIATMREYSLRGRLSDVMSARRGELGALLEIAKRHRNVRDKATRNHYRDLSLRIEQALGIRYL